MDISIPILEVGLEEATAYLREVESRRSLQSQKVEISVAEIFENIEKRGDEALFEYCKKFDNKDLKSSTIRLSPEIISEEAKKVSPELAETIRSSAARIETYHRQQCQDRSFSIETEAGTLSQHTIPMKRAALYIPGGHTVYPSTVLMCGIPAKLAGVEEIVAITPCREGSIAPEIAFALELLGITEVYQMGGAQGVAALAIGTESIPAVDKIVGPGNSYVAEAKRRSYGRVSIDSIAGPSDICILADSSANAEWLALDMLSQAEHGSGEESAILITESLDLAEYVKSALLVEISVSPVQDIFKNLSPDSLLIFVTNSREESTALVNAIGPEHLEIVTENPREDLKSIRNAPAIFLGNYSSVPLGDYVIGTNHVLPTGGASRYASPLGVDDFIKRVSVAEVTEAGIKAVAADLSRFARSEKFIHHAIAVERRAGMEQPE